MTEGHVVLRTKINGTEYGLGLDLQDFPTEELLRIGMKDLVLSLSDLLKYELKWWENQSE